MQNRRGLLAKRWKERVLAHLPEPIARVACIGFLAVDDGVPVASVGRIDILGDAVGRFPIPREQQRARKGGGLAKVFPL